MNITKPIAQAQEAMCRELKRRNKLSFDEHETHLLNGLKSILDENVFRGIEQHWITIKALADRKDNLLLAKLNATFSKSFKLWQPNAAQDILRSHCLPVTEDNIKVIDKHLKRIRYEESPKLTHLGDISDPLLKSALGKMILPTSLMLSTRDLNPADAISLYQTGDDSLFSGIVNRDNPDLAGWHAVETGVLTTIPVVYQTTFPHAGCNSFNFNLISAVHMAKVGYDLHESEHIRSFIRALYPNKAMLKFNSPESARNIRRLKSATCRQFLRALGVEVADADYEIINKVYKKSVKDACINGALENCNGLSQDWYRYIIQAAKAEGLELKL